MTAAAAVALTLACGPTPRGYCEGIAEASCARVFACTTGEAEAAALRTVYADEATCAKTLKTRSQCETQQDGDGVCGAGRHWVPANAAACVEEVRTVPCAQLAIFRPACASPCQ